MLSEQDLANRWGISVRMLQDWRYKKNGLAQSISLYHQQGGCAVNIAAQEGHMQGRMAVIVPGISCCRRHTWVGEKQLQNRAAISLLQRKAD